MTAPDSRPTRALVLGGGGAVGIGWQTGLLTGLREVGLDLSDADVVVGTSAGSVVGALLAARVDLAVAFSGLAGLAGAVDADALAAGSRTLLDVMERAGLEEDPRQAIVRVGRAAEQGSAIDERTYLDLFGFLADVPWPGTFRCTAVDTRTGVLRLWGPDSGIPLRHAVAASCAAPMVFPPVTLLGNRYLDGGVLSHLNAAAAPPTDRVIALSCFPLTATAATPDGWLTASTATVARELEALSGTRRLAAVEPRDDGVPEAAITMMDPGRAPAAHDLGLRQARHEHDRLAAVWCDPAR